MDAKQQMNMPTFIPGLQLSEHFYREAVKPILEKDFPNLEYSAALIGFGSEVLGFDTPQSRDHMWGPRLVLFLSETDFARMKNAISETLAHKLPSTFRGYSTNFGKPDKIGVRLFEEINTGLVNHLVQIYTIKSYFERCLGFNPYGEIDTLDWLTFSEHTLLTLTSGRVFYDKLGLEQIQHKFAYYPRDVWLYLLASQWTKIAQEEAFVGRCGDVGDELGSQIIAARLVQYLMRLCFLMERRYAPYSKWLGKAFERLESSEKLIPIFRNVMAAEGWQEREQHLSQAYEVIANVHNSLGITKPLETQVSQYYNRPYLVIHADVFAKEISETIETENLRTKARIGSINQFIDSTDVITNVKLCDRLRVMFEQVVFQSLSICILVLSML